MSFNVTIQPSGRSFDVARDETVLAAAIRQGIGLPYGCRDGACGSCKSKLLGGRVIHGAHQSKALSEAEEAAGLILTCCATPQTDCSVEARSVPGLGEFPILKMPTRVLAISRPAADVAVLRMQLPANQSFQYRAGQYVEFLLRDGARRSYSMANAPGNVGEPPAIELHIRHMPGGKFTDVVFSTLKEKDILRMEGPFGSFFLREGDKPMVLLASGTGFAPIKALIEQLKASGSQRPAVLYWGARRKADLYMHDWALQAAAEMPGLRYVPVLSEPAADDAWSGRSGLVHQAVMADLPDLAGHEVYACGAPLMVDAAQRDFTAQCGLPAEAFFADAFTSELDKQTGA
ncbi:CDP-6-deoxy-delta-3,4-glucoseen reductase [Aquabacterium sp. OR-4]|uniref:CDP-6-deoxy-delta-3,4-glucoseen reductase n=1 Tax=Aquabacterium sp. OR-4 TaxID=2978127 RepID=UPI0021B3C172|nr:CDP-6-deoxy-delta-3,4-glucoseen reductase [Aquabacterium sp. OR-4]MDT7836394.1 CDP-6-deoxy-delta-3,4-glucoseen reductase [Aquabacterium sp. OR-4]